MASRFDVFWVQAQGAPGGFDCLNKCLLLESLVTVSDCIFPDLVVSFAQYAIRLRTGGIIMYQSPRGAIKRAAVSRASASRPSLRCSPATPIASTARHMTAAGTIESASPSLEQRSRSAELTRWHRFRGSGRNGPRLTKSGMGIAI